MSRSTPLISTSGRHVKWPAAGACHGRPTTLCTWSMPPGEKHAKCRHQSRDKNITRPTVTSSCRPSKACSNLAQLNTAVLRYYAAPRYAYASTILLVSAPGLAVYTVQVTICLRLEAQNSCWKMQGCLLANKRVLTTQSSQAQQLRLAQAQTTGTRAGT